MRFAARALATMSRGRFAFALIAVAVAGCASIGPEPPRVSLVDVRAENSTVFEQRFVTTLRLINPNDLELKIAGYALDLELAGKPVASAASSEKLSLAALSETVVDVAFVGNALGLLSGARAALGGADLEAGVVGVIYADTAVGRIGLPIEEVARLD